ncbi:hypothetical protein SV7mr_46210 [Stieleria bergensis]|uniref:Uncharacterized protein n=1 Tax=Stieleria bergensis TaxID=2528025 RepID=A0A517T114_9BACT|nr:hypothetical protein SV7mr_46210 [Planctomycetes bacterium SV_7m_r]
MCRDPRSEVLDPHQVEAVHLYNRTIDGLYLLGKNPDTGEDFSYRQGWLVDKIVLVQRELEFANRRVVQDGGFLP